MPKHYGHHHRRRHRRHHKYHIHGPLVSSKQYCRVTCRQTLAVSGKVPSNGGFWKEAAGFAWQQPEGITTNTYGFNFTGSQFLRERTNWEEYAITGCRLHYVPATTTGKVTTLSGVNRNLSGIWSYDDPNTYAPITTQAEILNRKDTKAMPITKKWTLYKNARPFSAV